MRKWRLLLFATSVACSPAAPLSSAPNPPTSPPAPSPPSSPLTPALPVRPENALCTVRGQVSPKGVLWMLRTRLDAVPTMRVEDGLVTGWLTAGKRRHQPMAVAEVENSKMTIRALVATEDLKVVITKAFMSLPGHLPDGLTHRPVLEIESGEAWVDIGIQGAIGTVSTVPCSALGLEPSDVGTERLLPPARGAVVVKPGAYVKTDTDFVAVDGFWTPGGVEEPRGFLAELRGEDSDPLARLVSFSLCGGTVVGFVPKSHLLGPPKLLHGSSAHCSDVGASVFVTAAKLEHLVACPRELSVFLRSATLEDPVGILKAGARFRVDGGEAGGTTLVTVETPPAEPFEGVSFSVRSSELAGCTPAEAGESR